MQNARATCSASLPCPCAHMRVRERIRRGERNRHRRWEKRNQRTPRREKQTARYGRVISKPQDTAVGVVHEPSTLNLSRARARYLSLSCSRLRMQTNARTRESCRRRLAPNCRSVTHTSGNPRLEARDKKKIKVNKTKVRDQNQCAKCQKRVTDARLEARVDSTRVCALEIVYITRQ